MIRSTLLILLLLSLAVLPAQPQAAAAASSTDFDQKTGSFQQAPAPADASKTGIVDPQVWAALRAARDGRATFVVRVDEPAGRGPEGAITGQKALEPALGVLERLGLVSFYRVFYGPNVIVVHGGEGAVRSLAVSPGVAAIAGYGSTGAGAGLLAAPEKTALPAGTGQITGTVKAPNGTTPLPNIIVTAWFFDSDNGFWNQAAQATTGSSGSYTIGGLWTDSYKVEFLDPAGTYVAEFYNDKLMFDQADYIALFDGTTAGNVNATLALGGAVSGKITAAVGGGARADIVAYAWQFQNGAWVPLLSGTSSSTGNYTIRAIPVAPVRIRFSNPLYPLYADDVPEWYDNVPTIGLATNVPVQAGVTTANINAAIGMNGSIKGTVTAAGAVPVAGVKVQVYQYNSSLAAWQAITNTLTTSSGTYSLTLLGGTYRVGFTDPLEQLVPQYYNNAATIGTATSVVVKADGSSTSNINALMASAVVHRATTLAAGWNLISSPLAPTAAGPPDALSSIRGRYNLVYAYDGCQTGPWQKYDPGAPAYANNLSALGVKQGLWLKTTQAATLTMTGTLPIRTTFSLCQGWNLIGYPASDPRPITDTLSSIAGKYDLVQTYVAADAADPWKSYAPGGGPANDLLVLQPWYGYWIRMTQAGTLTIGNR